MSDVIASLIAKLSADTSGLDSALASSKSKINDMARQLGDTTSGVKNYDASMMQAMVNTTSGANAGATAVNGLNTASGGLMATMTNLRRMWWNVAWVGAGITAIGVATKQIYDMAAAGAQLDYTATKFDRLSVAAGTTSNIFLTQLRAATKGTVSDAGLMQQASDLMALGLAKDTSQAVQLSYGMTALNQDMGQLTLALANESTKRFDQLGVSLVGFKDKLQALKDTGMDPHQAFTMAFIQQEQEQIARVGNAADSSLGSYQRLTAGWQNYSNSVKQSLTDTFVPFNNTMAQTLNNQAEQQKALTAYSKYLEENPSAGMNIWNTGYGRTIALPKYPTQGSAQYQQDALNYYRRTVSIPNQMEATTTARNPDLVAPSAAIDTTDYANLLKVGTSLTDMTASYNDKLNQLAEKLIDQPKKYSATKDEANNLKNSLTGLNDMTIQYNASLMSQLQQLTATDQQYGKNDARVRELRESINALTNDAVNANNQMLLGTMKNAGANDQQQATFARAAGLISEQAYQQAISLSKISDAYINNKLTADQAAEAARGVASGLTSINGFNAIAYVDVYIRTHGDTGSIGGWDNTSGGVRIGSGSGSTTTRRAGGGPVSPGGIYSITEYGMPEVYTSGGKQYLLGGKGGYVEPSQSSATNSMNNYAMLAHIGSMLSPEAHAQALVKAMAKYWPTAG